MAYIFGYRFDGLGSTTTLFKFGIKYLINPLSSGVWWFITAYVFLILLHPLVNRAIAKINNKGLFIIIIFAWFFWYSFGELLDTSYYGVLRLLLFYLIGGYIRKYELIEKAKSKRVLMLIVLIACFFLFAISTWFGYKQGTAYTIIEILSVRLLRMLNTPVIIPISSTMIFLLIGGIKLNANMTVNTIASTTFGIYLLHDSVFVRNILWNKIFNVKDLYLTKWFIPLAIGIVCIIFVCCSLFDLFRQHYIEPMMLKILSKIECDFKDKCLMKKNN